jgi:bifunctional DNA-binding transcriptional regulator/antitoxin component of YhaV-PrlF toxin-antitoxin module
VLSARTRISKHHQITIPLGPFRKAGLHVGQAVRVAANGDGRLTLEPIAGPFGDPTASDAALF